MTKQRSYIIVVTTVALLAATCEADGSYNDTTLSDLRMFFNVSDALEFFKNDSSDLALRIVRTFQVDCRSRGPAEGEGEEEGLPKKRKPFIVVEGDHRTSRNVIGMRLARQMRGRYLVHPAPCLQRFASALPRGTRFRRAFYILSLFALSDEARAHLTLGRAVVVNGYWWDMLTFALVQACPGEGGPPPPSLRPDLFQIPPGLLPPDIVFYLHFPDSLFRKQPTTRNPQTWKPRLLSLYQRLESDRASEPGPRLMVRPLRGAFAVMTDALMETVVTDLAATRDVCFHTPQRKRVNFDY